MKKILSLIFLFIMVTPAPLPAKKGDAGNQSGMFLDLPVGARPVALGSSYVSIADDVYALFYNPAGLGQLKMGEVSFQHNEYFQGLSAEYGAVTIPFWYGQAGLAVSYLSYGDIQRTTLNDPQGLNTGNYTARDMALQASYGARLNPNSSFGMSIKLFNSKLDGISGTNILFDAGAIYEIPFTGIKFGVVLQNISNQFKYMKSGQNLPLLFKAGSSIRTDYFFGVDITATIDVIKRKDESWAFAAGTEIRPYPPIALRAGYNSEIDVDAGYSLGLGLQHDYYSLDYAYVPFGKLGQSHRVSGSVRFGTPQW